MVKSYPNLGQGFEYTGNIFSKQPSPGNMKQQQLGHPSEKQSHSHFTLET